MDLDKACELAGTGWCMAHEQMGTECATLRERDRCVKILRDLADDVLDSDNPGDKSAFEFFVMAQKRMRAHQSKKR